MWRVAAAVLVLAAAGAVWWRLAPNRSAQMVVAATANGERRTIPLGDGSSALLNGGSRLRYAKSGGRDVYLEGEAFFEVRHDPRRPFRVYAGGGVVQDVGTTFNVRAYEMGVEVAVSSGSVTLAAEQHGRCGTDNGRSVVGNDCWPRRAATALTLTAGQTAVLEASGAVRRIEQPVDRLTGWVTGDLVLNDVTLTQAALELERAFGARVMVADPTLATRRVSARFHRETIVRALDAVVVALGATYERRDSTFIIRPRTAR